MKRLSLVDGSGFLFRAWYAFPPMFNEEGNNQNVVYGFISMLFKYLLEMPEFFAIAWDSPVKTKRHLAYPEYKANRKKTEDEFKRQIPLVRELIDDLNIPNVIAPGYEADDIIATFVANYCSDPELMIQVFSSDKDLKQFLRDNVVITDPLKNETTFVNNFRMEFGFEPKSIVDYLALIGDSADNIKGVSGIGPKRASTLIQQYGTIEHIYASLDELPSDLKGKLQEGKFDAFFSKDLVLLMQVPEFKAYALEDMKFIIDLEHRQKILFEKWKFSSLEKRFEDLRKKCKQPQQLGLF